MDYSSDLSDCHDDEPDDDSAPADCSSSAGATPFNNVAALAYARWEALRSGSDLPSITHRPSEETRLFLTSCVQVAWDKDVSIPTISYLGKDLADQLANLSGEAWPNLPIDSPLVAMLRKVSRRAIEERDAWEFDEQVVDSGGWIRDYQGLALPFAGTEPGAFLVDVIFDLDNPLPTETARPHVGAEPDPDDVLLLEQELDPDEMPRPAMAPSPPPVLFVCVANDKKRAISDSRKARPGWVPAVRVRPTGTQRADSATHPVFARRILAVQSTPEPFLLTEPLEVPPGNADTQAPAEASDHLLLSLEAARHQAAAASTSEERSHAALYNALGATYDFALQAANEPERLEQIILDAGLKMQARAPMTPVAKLIFGASCDRSRLAEYATALSYAFRLGLPAGGFADYLLMFDGGLKGIVKAERELRGNGQGRKSELAKLETKLRETPVDTLESLEREDREFSLVIARRMPDGRMALVGKVPADERLFCCAARRFLKAT